jgi:hypothetical protein
MIAPLDILDFYGRNNFRLVYWPAIRDSKGPHEKGWTERAYTRDDYRDGSRVGIMCGVEIAPGRFLHDVDIDWAPGASIAQALLPATDLMFGRASKKVSHCWYTTPEPLQSSKYEDPTDKSCRIELRGTKLDGTIGNQAMAPPSVWSKEAVREPLEFVRMRVPTHIADAALLKQRVTFAAIALLLGRDVGKQGFGHEVRLACAGFLLRSGLTPDDVVAIGDAIISFTGNRDAHDIRETVASTKKRLDAKDRKVKGGPALAKSLGAAGAAIIKRIDEWLGRSDAGDIHQHGGDLAHNVDRIEAALLPLGRIYQRGNMLVRFVTPDRSHSSDAVRRGADSRIIIPVGEVWLRELMSRELTFRNKNGSKADPDPVYARTLLQRGEWSFPILRGVVTTPTLTRDGRIIEQPGYDADSGLFVDLTRTFPPIPQQPTREDALAALHRLETPLRGFPFQDDAAKSVALSAMLTALVRRSLRTAPLHGFDAPMAGTGKSLLAELVGVLALGFPPAALSQGKSDEEDEKRWSVVLFAADLIAQLDNCERPIQGDFLCSLLTQEVVQARILGHSERRILPCTTLVLATGNNLTLAGDASRRAVICRLDAQVERPDAREFDFDCHAEVLRTRADLVVAALTILRAYHVAGRPNNLPPMGSFNDWAWIRGALVWLGRADPADTRITILDSDPRKNELSTVMDLWAAAFGPDAVAVADIAPQPPTFDLHTKLIEVACRGKWSGKSVGWWLRRHKDRIVNGRSFHADIRKTDRGQLWSLVGDVPAVERSTRELGSDDHAPF